MEKLMLERKIDEMDKELEKLTKVLQAKEAVLEDVLCSINQLPRHPGNASLIQNILASHIKQTDTVLEGFDCCITWTALFQEYICVNIELENNTSYFIFPSCAAFCSNDVSDTATAIFDNFDVSHCVPPKSKRSLMTSFQKSLFISSQVTLILDCEIVQEQSSDIDLALLPLLPEGSQSKQTRIVKVFGIDEPFFSFSLDKVNELTLKEGMNLYQCLYCCYQSEQLNITSSRLRAILRKTEKNFIETDFGDWQLFTGASNTIWNDFTVFVYSSLRESSSEQNRIFAKNECDVRRLAKMLIEKDINSLDNL